MLANIQAQLFKTSADNPVEDLRKVPTLKMAPQRFPHQQYKERS